MYNTKEQSKPNSADHKHERFPHNAERSLNNVKRQCVALRMETTVGPDQPRRETHEDGRTKRGQVYEPERWEPKWLVYCPVIVAGAEQYDGEHG